MPVGAGAERLPDDQHPPVEVLDGCGQLRPDPLDRGTGQERGESHVPARPLGGRPQIVDNAAQQTVVVVDRLQGAAYFLVE